MNNWTLREIPMIALAIAIALLFTLIGITAVLTIADCALKARHAYRQLAREAALMEAGFAVQVSAQELRVRRATMRIMQDRPRAQALPLPRHAFAVA